MGGNERKGGFCCLGGRIALILARPSAKFDLRHGYIGPSQSRFFAQSSQVVRDRLDSGYSGSF